MVHRCKWLHEHCVGLRRLQTIPMSTPTAIGATYLSDAKTVPMETPLPKCASAHTCALLIW